MSTKKIKGDLKMEKKYKQNNMTDDQKTYCRSKIMELMFEIGSASKLSRALGVRAGAVGNWIHGRTFPNMENALKIQKISKGKIKRHEIRPDISW